MSDITRKRFFTQNFKKGLLVSRPNRFVVTIEIDGKLTGASLPNPGKLGELFIPGCALFLQEMGPQVKYPYRVIAVESSSGEVVMLDTHVNNRVAEYLIDNKAIPSLRSYSVKRREVSVGRSRFDLLLEDEQGEELFCEVKSCTLFGGKLAMFPDAVTARGKRHVEELSEMSRKGIPTTVLFIVQSKFIDFFSPDYHTDHEFSQSLYKSRKALKIICCTAGWDRNLDIVDSHREVPVLWDLYENEGQEDRGFFIMLLSDDKGYYLCLSSEERDLAKKIERYKRKKKKPSNVLEEIRYLKNLEMTWAIRAPLVHYKEIEKSLSVLFEKIGNETGFSLFRSDANPKLMRGFQDLLLEHRMIKPLSRYKEHCFDIPGE